MNKKYELKYYYFKKFSISKYHYSKL